MKKSFIVILLLSLFMSFALFGDDGMWMPHQMKDLNLQEKGLKMNPADLYKKDGSGIMSAIVNLGGGTGEFVSSKGLILTNHHVAFGAIQRASSKENDYIKNGFLAKDFSQEIQAPGYRADVLLEYRDVTKEMLKGASKSNLKKREKRLNKNRERLTNEAESKGKDIVAYVRSMYSGNKYYLFVFKRLKDVRIVYAPPRDLGNYGGDIDNWMWPRHTCDFTFLRAYVSKDNIGRSYNKDNVPYKPKSYLKISLEGLKEHDFNFVMGYPGRTYRNKTLAEVQSDLRSMEKRLKRFKETINFFENAGKNNREVQIKYASIIKGLNNALKNYEGKIEGIRKFNVLDIKKKNEEEIIAFIKENNARNKKYAKVFSNIVQKLKEYEKMNEKISFISGLSSSYGGSTLLAISQLLYTNSLEAAKKDSKRKAFFKDKNKSNLIMSLKLVDRSFDFNTDKEYLKFILNKLQKSKVNLPDFLKEVIGNKGEKINAWVDNAYKKTKLNDVNYRINLLKKSNKEIKSLNDPLINLSAKIYDALEVYKEKNKKLYRELYDLQRKYKKVLLLKNKDKIAPDANSTIRFTFGTIENYSPQDAVQYHWQTSLKGLFQKETGSYPFAIPDKVKELAKNKDFGIYFDKNLGDLPLCFLNTTNVTGGNSGSPVLNAKGEQVGIIFDMTYESVIGDYYVIPELQRTICVDIRYVLWVSEKFGGADNIIKEISFVK